MKSKISYTLLLIFFWSLSGFAQKQKDEARSYLDDLAIYWKNEEDTLKLMVRNRLFTPLGIYLSSKETKQELESLLLKAKDSLALVSYVGTQPDSIFKSNYSDSIRVSYYFGHESVIDPDTNYLYRFPFKKRKKYEVTQSFNGKFSHSSVMSKYAIDFRLNIGDPVHAAREGTVVKVIDWFTKSGGKEFQDAANKIVILHSDGTMATYAHLDYKGSFVEEGEYVERGQKIGTSGLTGYTRGPHLHFVVRREKDIAVPIYFKGHEGEVLKKGKRYKVRK